MKNIAALNRIIGSLQADSVTDIKREGDLARLLIKKK